MAHRTDIDYVDKIYVAIVILCRFFLQFIMLYILSYISVQ